jgi:hypothetical protein
MLNWICRMVRPNQVPKERVYERYRNQIRAERLDPLERAGREDRRNICKVAPLLCHGLRLDYAMAYVWKIFGEPNTPSTASMNASFWKGFASILSAPSNLAMFR